MDLMRERVAGPACRGVSVPNKVVSRWAAEDGGRRQVLGPRGRPRLLCVRGYFVAVKVEQQVEESLKNPSRGLAERGQGDEKRVNKEPSPFFIFGFGGRQQRPAVFLMLLARRRRVEGERTSSSSVVWSSLKYGQNVVIENYSAGRHSFNAPG